MLSIVIPTLDAVATLGGTLSALDDGRGSDALEVIVADGGSTDTTVAIARAHGARAILAPRGRGPQLAAGATAARGEWLLFLHADTRLVSGWRTALSAVTDRPDADRLAGYFRFVLDDESAVARRLERIVAWRAGCLGLPYGDQGLVLHRACYAEIGGFAPLPLMEDVDLVRRLGRRRLVALPGDAITSAVRFRRSGYLMRSTRNLFCLGLYFAGVPPRRIARLYG